MAHTRRVAIVPGFYKQLNQLSTADFSPSPKRRKAPTINGDKEGVYAVERVICSRASKTVKVSSLWYENYT